MFVFLFLPKLILAQDDITLKEISSTYAILHVNIIPTPGKLIESGTVVVKDGLIASVGKNIPIPPEALIIDADSMYLYAGFIDGLTRVGVGKSPEGSHKKIKDRGNPDPEEAGITPYRFVSDYLNADDRAIQDYRFIGFTTAQVVPEGMFMPGHGAIILIDNESERGLVLKDNSCFYAEFTSNKSVYPATIMGIMAKWRELYQQASLQRSYASVYTSNRNGLQRPVSNPVLDSFYPVMDKKMPVVFNSENVLDIQHAIKLKQDLGFDLVLANVREGWDLIPKIKSSQAKVFLSLDLPEILKKDSTIATDSEKGRLLKRKEEFIAKYVAQASMFEQAGIKFGFSSLCIKAKDIRPNIRRMIDAGLSEDAALAALTTHAAELLGVSDRIGSIEKGKMANFFISEKKWFDEKSKVRYVFVDGVLYTCSDKPPKKNEKSEIEGTWRMTTETPQGKTDLKVIFRKEANEYKGNISGKQLPEKISFNSVTFKNNKLCFIYSVTVEGTAYDIIVEGNVDGAIFKGEMKVANYGSFPIDGKHEPKL